MTQIACPAGPLIIDNALRGVYSARLSNHYSCMASTVVNAYINLAADPVRGWIEKIIKSSI